MGYRVVRLYSWNWEASVEPFRAVVEDWPELTTVETRSK